MVNIELSDYVSGKDNVYEPGDTFFINGAQYTLMKSAQYSEYRLLELPEWKYTSPMDLSVPMTRHYMRKLAKLSDYEENVFIPNSKGSHLGSGSVLKFKTTGDLFMLSCDHQNIARLIDLNTGKPAFEKTTTKKQFKVDFAELHEMICKYQQFEDFEITTLVR